MLKERRWVVSPLRFMGSVNIYFWLFLLLRVTNNSLWGLAADMAAPNKQCASIVQASHCICNDLSDDKIIKSVSLNTAH